MMTVKVEIYNKLKYDKESSIIATQTYNINGYTMISGGTGAAEIEANTDGNSIDDFHEYLVLELENGETCTFRNSYVDVFKKGIRG